MKFVKPDFGQPPPGYIPGLGRAAIGFVTRSDLGPMHLGNEEEMGPSSNPNTKQEETDRGDYSDTHFDKWSGFQGSLFSGGEFDDEDREADKAYDRVDEYMDGRRNVRREKRIQMEIAKIRTTRPTIRQQFSDLKRDLATVSLDEWEGIPDIGERKIKRKKYERFMPVPDNIISAGLGDGEMGASVIDTQGDEGLGGTLTSLTDLGQARGQLLSLQLDKASDSVTGQSVVNKSGYLTGLESLKINNETEISDIKKARLLLKSVLKTNPKNGSGWIAAARIEELDGKMEEARNIIAQGCQNCGGDSEDVWLEAARLAVPKQSKGILAKGISQYPSSLKLWRAAAGKEIDPLQKKKLIRKALEFIPNSPILWKEVIELETEEEAKLLLYKAVECIPYNVDMWLALAKLENYSNARVVLNKARHAIPTDHGIWIHAAKLEETQNSDPGLVEAIILRAIRNLTKNNVILSREAWIGEAESCEMSGSVMTSRAIIKCIITSQLEKGDYKRTWIIEATELIEKGSLETARNIYKEGLKVLADSKTLWIKAVELEEKYGGSEKVIFILSEAVKNCSKAVILWLMYAKKVWRQGDIEGSRKILMDAKSKHPECDPIILAIVKFESQNKNYEAAEELLQEARKWSESTSVWIVSSNLYREIGNYPKAIQLTEAALGLFPNTPKLWRLLTLIMEESGSTEFEVREIFEKALISCKSSPKLWVAAGNYEYRKQSLTRARMILQEATLKIEKEPLIWLARVRLEVESDNPKIAENLLSKALQECPISGILWAEAIKLEPLYHKKAKSIDALKICETDEKVMLEVAKLFWHDKKYEKTRNWLRRSIALNPKFGDGWAYYYKFEESLGESGNLKEIIEKCREIVPTKGEAWREIAKKVENWREDVLTILVKVAQTIIID